MRYTYQLAGIAIASVLIGGSIIFTGQTVWTVILACLLMTITLVLIAYIDTLLEAKTKVEWLSTTLQAAVTLHWQWDLKSGVFTYKGPLPQLLGYPADLNIDTAFWQKIIHPVDRPLQKYQLLRHLEDETQPYYCEYRMQDHAGKYQWFAGRGKIISRDKTGGRRFMAGNIEHIQPRKDLEESLIQAHKMEALGQLTGGIAHDFNNILASLLGYTELALDTSQDNQQRVYLQEIHQSGHRARTIIRQLLDFSKTTKSDTQIVKLKQETIDAVHMLRASLPGSITIDEIYPNDECFTRLDPNQFQRILLNLGINARDAMSARGVLSISLATTTQLTQQCTSCQQPFEGKHHSLQISDNGEGIQQEIDHKLFEPFFTTKAFGKGTGMGLSVVHGIVHDYNGHIIISSTMHEGTTVTLYFPCLGQEKAQLEVLANRFSIPAANNNNAPGATKH